MVSDHWNTANCIHRNLSSSLKCSARTSSISVKTHLKVFGKSQLQLVMSSVLRVQPYQGQEKSQVYWMTEVHRHTVSKHQRPYTDRASFSRWWTLQHHLWIAGSVKLHSNTCEVLRILWRDRAIIEFHGDDLEAGRLTLHRDMFIDIAKQGCLPKTLDFLKGEEGEQTLLPELTKLVRLDSLFLWPPAHQRGLSQACGTMGQWRLNHLAVLNCHKNITKSRNLDAIAVEFIRRRAARKNTFLLRR